MLFAYWPIIAEAATTATHPPTHRILLKYPRQLSYRRQFLRRKHENLTHISDGEIWWILLQVPVHTRPHYGEMTSAKVDNGVLVSGTFVVKTPFCIICSTADVLAVNMRVRWIEQGGAVVYGLFASSWPCTCGCMWLGLVFIFLAS